MTEKFEFRNIRPDEAEQAVEISRSVFLPTKPALPKA